MTKIASTGLLLAAIFWLVACGQSEVPPTETGISDLVEAVDAAGEETATPESTLRPTLTSTPLPSATPLPTSTPAPTATSTPTATPTRAPQLVDSVSLVELASGFNRPTQVTHAFDARLFVVEQVGRIMIVKGGEVLDRPFIDIAERVASSSLEQGLLSVAFHPDYAQNGRLFVYYTDRTGATVVSEFRAASGDPDLADAASERTILRAAQPYVNHNGGQLHFGPDGMLYVGLGDGGSAGDPGQNGQNPGTLLGSILRLDVDGPEPYGIPADNPFIGQSGFRPETWAYGLRNPWRFSFDRLTGDLYIGDVGQNAWEEINFQPAGSTGGQNYGWNALEASKCYVQGCDPSGTTLPIGEYAHGGLHCSVTGGFVYRGSDYPSLWGNYFYADYCSGVVWSLIPAADGAWAVNQLLDSPYQITSFGEDFQGELYAVDQSLGLLLRLTPG